MTEIKNKKKNICPTADGYGIFVKGQEHCPNCLCQIHKEDDLGEWCGGTLEPVSVWIKDDGSWQIVQRCRLCGEMRTAEMTGQDSPIKVLSIASKPMSAPPFPLEKIQELTRLMGGQGGEDYEP